MQIFHMLYPDIGVLSLEQGITRSPFIKVIRPDSSSIVRSHVQPGQGCGCGMSGQAGGFPARCDIRSIMPEASGRGKPKRGIGSELESMLDTPSCLHLI